MTEFFRLDRLQIATAIDKISETLGQAEKSFGEFLDSGGGEWYQDAVLWHVDLAFQQLSVLTEALGLTALHADVKSDWVRAKERGYLADEEDPDGGIELECARVLRRHKSALEAVFGPISEHSVTKDLESIIRAATYSLADRRVFSEPPANEDIVHHRLENILKPVFTDLIHKPALAKPIKNFQPDTGIPSISALVEYKFLARASQVGSIADELLADTRGYVDPRWTSFLYVIYETHRIRPESDWRNLLRKSGVDERTNVVVLSGEPTKEKPRSRRRTANSKSISK